MPASPPPVTRSQRPAHPPVPKTSPTAPDHLSPKSCSSAPPSRRWTLCFNHASLAVGYTIPRLLRLDQRQSIAIGMEIGIHNPQRPPRHRHDPPQQQRHGHPPATYSLIMFFTAAAFGFLVNRGHQPD